jgi:hypothetical protein
MHEMHVEHATTSEYNTKSNTYLEKGTSPPQATVRQKVWQQTNQQTNRNWDFIFSPGR